ncbi:hypothetical protein FGG08_002466 [Glutinoglossum americanum]|uniref:BTB domain-containing protein n=1 Tax=Glutinoglossum americanum TaxID=1670608 RepID=A0A9P8I4M9_9PEZI|nr:hypothetical protein FGG08_002466 [Glutinoglossum americanum]
MLYSKDQLEVRLLAEKKEISEGRLRDYNPLDTSRDFQELCEACRRGDVLRIQELITIGVNVNAVDEIRKLLLQYEYSKATHPLQPFASHLASLLSRSQPETSDIVVNATTQSLRLHKFVLSARSPYFRRVLAHAPKLAFWELPYTCSSEIFEAVIQFLYLGDIPAGLVVPEEDAIASINELTRQLEISGLLETILESEDRRPAQQMRADEMMKGRLQLEEWFENNVLKHKIVLETSKVGGVQWRRDNPVFADVLLRADEDPGPCETNEKMEGTREPTTRNMAGPLNGLPVSPMSESRSLSCSRKPRVSTLYPVHRAVLIRSDFFMTMFNSPFREAQRTEYLQIISIDCSPEVLEAVLAFLYAEKAEFSLDLAIDVLFAADLLLIEKLKVRAAAIISTLGNDPVIGRQPSEKRRHQPSNREELAEPKMIDIYDIIRTGWLTRVHRLEEFGAKYLADRLEDYINDDEFAELIQESAKRIKQRQETDSIELLDDIRHYLSERFRLRFEEPGLKQMMAENDHEAPSKPKDDTSGGLTPNEKGDGDGGVGLASSGPRTGDQMLPGDQELGGTMLAPAGEAAGEEYATDARTYQMLLDKIESLLDRLELGA